MKQRATELVASNLRSRTKLDCTQSIKDWKQDCLIEAAKTEECEGHNLYLEDERTENGVFERNERYVCYNCRFGKWRWKKTLLSRSRFLLFFFMISSQFRGNLFPLYILSFATRVKSYSVIISILTWSMTKEYTRIWITCIFIEKKMKKIRLSSNWLLQFFFE